ncbi:hypothetical protein [Sporomusa acidovorans]|uniref:hypothetical protein n=1 Tax=Sporomusa acidovorans TaxID=112900 RepID=UPI001FDFCFBF|nr:hypothetical protein [Sporomusa acidovorans]
MNQESAIITQAIPFPPQHQNQQPGIESQMNPRPVAIWDNYRPSGKLENKTALISGGDSGIGRAAALIFLSCKSCSATAKKRKCYYQYHLRYRL